MESTVSVKCSFWHPHTTSVQKSSRSQLERRKIHASPFQEESIPSSIAFFSYTWASSFSKALSAPRTLNNSSTPPRKLLHLHSRSPSHKQDGNHRVTSSTRWSSLLSSLLAMDVSTFSLEHCTRLPWRVAHQRSSPRLRRKEVSTPLLPRHRRWKGRF